VNVNVTLIFGIENYKAVTDAYLAGLEQLGLRGPSVRGGHPLNAVASVASFFVSRVTPQWTRSWKKGGPRICWEKSGLPTARSPTRNTGGFSAVRAGASYLPKAPGRSGCCGPAPAPRIRPTPIRFMWMGLIGPETVNTLPPETVKAFIDHGHAAETLTGIWKARAVRSGVWRSSASTLTPSPASSKRKE